MLTYESALEYIYSFTDYEKKSNYHYAPETFDLARIERLLDLLGAPHRFFPSAHVAGTKGKGSTSAILASILQTAGYRTGLFTSPHLHTFRERVRLNGCMIAPHDVADLIERIRPLADQVEGITTFEVVTAMAMLYFRERAVDAAVLEVGLGGRLDATNVVVPEVAVITPISYDHMHLLGNTLAEIAREKAGIIKPGIPVVIAPQQPEALDTIRQMAEERGAPLTLVDRDFKWQRTHVDLEGQTFLVSGPDGQAVEYRIPLLGEHQVVNAVTALAAASELQRRGMCIPGSARDFGLRTVYWPGRMEILSRDPFLIVDSAHNADSAHKLMSAVCELFPRRPIVLLFGASADKDIDGMLSEFIPIVSHLVLVRADHARAAEPADLLQRAVALGGSGCVIEHLEDAVTAALDLAGPAGVICAAGSVFVAGGVRQAWAMRTGRHLPEWD